jgi:hypothetical protein
VTLLIAHPRHTRCVKRFADITIFNCSVRPVHVPRVGTVGASCRGFDAVSSVSEQIRNSVNHERYVCTEKAGKGDR